MPGRGNHFILQLAEVVWLLSGRNTFDDFLSDFASSDLKKFVDKDGILPGGFGPRIRPYLGYIVDLLTKNPSSRSAVINVFDISKDIHNTHHKPCLMTISYLVTGDTVSGYTTLRANDIIKGATAINIIQSIFFLRLVAYCLGKDVGNLTFFTPTLHYYEGQSDRIERMLSMYEKYNTYKPPSISQESLFDMNVPMHQRLSTILSDVDALYTFQKNYECTHPIFGYIQQILGGRKNNTHDFLSFLPEWLLLPVVECLTKNHSFIEQHTPQRVFLPDVVFRRRSLSVLEK